MLKNYKLDLAHIIQQNEVPIKENISYKEQPMKILARELKVLCNMEISLVKALWKHHKKYEATWELETNMYKKYPHLFNFKLEVVLQNFSICNLNFKNKIP